MTMISCNRLKQNRESPRYWLRKADADGSDYYIYAKEPARKSKITCDYTLLFMISSLNLWCVNVVVVSKVRVRRERCSGN